MITNKRLSAFIIDNDYQSRSILKKYLDLTEYVDIVGSYSSPETAWEKLLMMKPDVVFLEAVFPNSCGIELGKKIRDRGVRTQLVYTTIYEKYAVDVFCLKPLDYILKPFGPDAIFDTVTKLDKVIDLNNRAEKESILWGHKIPNKLKFPISGGFVFYSTSKIVFLQAYGAYSKMHLDNGEEVRILESITGVYDTLKHFNFVFINRAEIINIKHLTRFERDEKMCYVKHCNKMKKFKVTQRALRLFDKVDSVKMI